MPDPILLDGLDGSNPLGFLAALGTLALCERLDLHPRMCWVEHANSYRPRLHLRADLDQAELSLSLTNVLRADLKISGAPSWCATDLIKRPAADYRREATQALTYDVESNRHAAAFFAAFASDAIVGDDGDVIRSQFSFANGQSGKVLLRDYRDLIDELTVEQMSDAIFLIWRYQTRCKTLQWDPADYRPYAMRAQDPGDGRKSPVTGVPAANVLGLWGLLFYPSYPTSGGLATSGFNPEGHRYSSRRTAGYFHWPLWEAWLDSDVVRSLVTMAELHAAQEGRAHLVDRGVASIRSSEKFKIGAPPTTRFYFSESVAI